MTPQELKNSILQLAIQGKLVEQRAEDGTAEALYAEIQKEKQKLIKEGKIKKEKPLPEITDDEKPFDIPDSWKWVRWGEIINIVSARRVHQSDWKSEGIPFYRAREIAKLAENGYVDNDLFISQELFDEFAKSGVPKAGDLMVTAVGTLGKTYIVRADDHFYYKDASVICFENYAHLISEYLKFLMRSEMMMNQIRSNSDGTTVATLTMVRMVEYIIPLPPLAEQKRIVAKIEELLPLIDRYEQAWSKLEEFNKRFPTDMQKSILQMAIEGKLVEQRPEEGTGEDLYRQIQAEKQKLSKEGKIKKDKPLPEITDDEKPFDIPESWMWYRIGDVFKIVNGFTPLKTNSEFWDNGDIPWFTIEDVRQQGRFISSTEKHITPKALSKDSERIVPADTVLLCCTASVGEYAYTRIPLTTNQQFNAFVVRKEYETAVYPLFVFEFAKTLKDKFIDKAGKTTFNFVSVGKLNSMLIPLPPLAEQKRIVEKLNQLLPLCERLK